MDDYQESGELLLIGALHIYDDGRDYTARLVWQMGERKRISEGTFSLPPPCPQVVPPKISPKKKPAARRRRKVKPESDF